MPQTLRIGASTTLLLTLLAVAHAGSAPYVREAGGPAAVTVAPQAATDQSEPRPRVFMYATGGTISNRSGGRLTVDELIRSVPALDRWVQADGEQFANTSSSSLTLAQWLELSRRINARFRDDPDLAGIVVTSGTDTLEETAYFLHLTVRDERPVVVVGAMRNPSTLGYEGAANLEDAFRVAADPASRGLGSLVVLNDEINSAREATKTDALRLDTFTSRRYGVLGVADRDRVVYFRKPVKRHSAWSEFDLAGIDDLPRVDIILTYQGAPGDLIRAAVDAGARGIVIAGAGAGATSGTQGEAIRYAYDQGVFVVSSSRTGSGRVAGRAGGNDWRIAGDDLQPLKARILLMLALSRTDEPAEIKRMFAEY